MPHAARIGDPIGHSPAMSYLLQGLAIGAAVGIGAALVIGTGGLAGAAIVGGLAAGGAGIGELMSSMSWASKEVCGELVTGSSDVFYNGRPAARAHVDSTLCSKHSGLPPIATGSATVFINNMPSARVDDNIKCGAVIVEGSPDISIGGGTVATDAVDPENLVPGWLHAGLFIAGIGSAVILGGPVVAALGLAGAYGGGAGGAWLGGKIFGEGSDGQKWTMLGGSIVGGGIGVKGGAWFNRNYTIKVEGLGSNLGNVKIVPKAGSVTEAVEGIEQRPIFKLSKEKYPNHTKMLENAQEEGHPLKGLKKGSGTREAQKNRYEAQKEIRKQQGAPPEGYDYDEFPYASTKQGGKGAHVEPVPSEENQAAGRDLGQFYKKYKIKEDDVFDIEINK